MKIISRIRKKIKNNYMGGVNSVKDFILNSIGGSPLCSFVLRRWLYGLYGHRVSKVFSNCVLGEGPGKLLIKRNTFVNHGCFFDLGDNITIEENCSIAMKVSFINGTHEWGSHEKRGGIGFTKPIIVKKGCWIGANVTILPGIIIEEGCFIAAGAVVTKNCERDGFYAGVPAKLIKKFTD